MDIKDLANYGGFVVGTIGIILSIYLYRKGLEKKDPRCFYRTYREIEKLSPSGDSNIQILYKSKDVERVFTSYLWLWNKGKKAINQSDIPPQSNITIKLNDKEHDPRILDYRILKTSRDEINFRATSVSENKLSVAFDFLDYNDGAVIEVQHTGSHDTAIGIEGIILGVPNGIAVTSRQSSGSILDFYRRMMFSRERVVRPTRLFVHKSLRQRFMSILTYLIMFIIVVGFFVWFGYFGTTRTHSTVSMTSDNLKKILVSELPQIPNQSIQNILEKATESPNFDKAIYLMLAYAIMFTLAFGSVIWSEFSSPIPKSLYFRDDGEKNQ